MILKCDCKNDFQDKEYGFGNRVHNPTYKDKKLSGWRCAVCLKEKGRQSDDVQINKGE